jgi:hypothetical protein
MDIAGHVSKRMLRHYSHIRMEAKRAALESIVSRKANDSAGQESPQINSKKSMGYPQNSWGYRNPRRASEAPEMDYAESPINATVFAGATHKSPHNRQFLRLVGERRRAVSY